MGYARKLQTVFNDKFVYTTILKPALDLMDSNNNPVCLLDLPPRIIVGHTRIRINYQ
jgi:hypothetical protein